MSSKVMQRPQEEHHPRAGGLGFGGSPAPCSSRILLGVSYVNWHSDLRVSFSLRDLKEERGMKDRKLGKLTTYTKIRDLWTPSNLLQKPSGVSVHIAYPSHIPPITFPPIFCRAGEAPSPQPPHQPCCGGLGWIFPALHTNETLVICPCSKFLVATNETAVHSNSPRTRSCHSISQHTTWNDSEDTNRYLIFWPFLVILADIGFPILSNN